MTRSAPDCPIPEAALAELTLRLSLLPVPVIVDDSWRDCPPLYATPGPIEQDGNGVHFDVDAAVRAIRACTALRHVKGRHARTPFVPDPWQVVWVLAPVFGWRYDDDHPRWDLAGTRVIRRVWVEIPRKNGKTTLCSALALVLLCADDEPGAEVYAAATSRDQARQCFDPAKVMAQAAPLLAGRVKVLRDVIRYEPLGGFFRVLSRLADAAHGLNVHGAVIDEVHVHHSRELIDAIETGVGARAQPLVVCITTADEGDDFTIYAEKRGEVVNIAQGNATDVRVWGAIWASPDEEDPYDPATWARCNPGLGRSLTLASLEGEAQKAQTSASYKPTFLRLSLNRRVRQAHRWLDIADYDAPGNLGEGWAPPDGLAAFPDGLRGRKAWAGVDLSAVSDLTALGLWIPDDPNSDLSAGWSFTWSWLPEDDLLERCERDGVPYDRWARDGWVRLTEGNTVDYQPILDTLYALKGLLRMEAIALDRWQAHRILQELTVKKAAKAIVELPQTYQGLSEGCKAVERAILAGRFRHPPDPVKRWAYSQVEVARDQVDNIKPIKPNRGMTAARIDPVMADVIAGAAWQRRERKAAPSAVPPAVQGGGGSVFASNRRLSL